MYSWHPYPTVNEYELSDLLNHQALKSSRIKAHLVQTSFRGSDPLYSTASHSELGAHKTDYSIASRSTSLILHFEVPNEPVRHLNTVIIPT